MANWSDPQIGPGVQPATTIGRDVAFDAGLRGYMLSVYNYMASAVLLTGIVAYAVAASGWALALFNPQTGGASLLGYVAIFAPLVLVFVMSFGINRLSTGAAQALSFGNVRQSARSSTCAPPRCAPGSTPSRCASRSSPPPPVSPPCTEARRSCTP